MAEQLALEQAVGQRGAVDGDERAVAPVSGAMHDLGEELLPRAGLALQKHREVAVGHRRTSSRMPSIRGFCVTTSARWMLPSSSSAASVRVRDDRTQTLAAWASSTMP